MTGPTTTGSIDAKLTIDKSAWDVKVAEAKAEAKELGDLSPTVRVDANVGPAVAKMAELEAIERKLEQQNIRLTATEKGLNQEQINSTSGALRLATVEKMLGEAFAGTAGAARKQAEATGESAAATEAAGEAAGGAAVKISSVAIAEQRLENAQRMAANAASTAYIANERLNAMREKGGATALQLATAEEAVARADRNAEAAEKKHMAAIEALNLAKDEAARKSLEQAAANDVETESAKKSTQANKERMQGWQVLVALAPALLGPVSAIAASAVGLGVAFGVAGVSGVLAIKGIKDAMEVGDSVGNAYASGIVGLKDDLNALAGTSATAMLGSFNTAVTNINSQMPSLTQMVHDGSAALGHMGDTALRGVLAGLSEMNPLIHAGEVELSKFVTWLFSFNGTSGFHDFIQYAIDNLPATMHLIENLVTLAGHILAAYAPLGPVMLAFLNLITDIGNNMPLPALAGLVAAATLIGPALRMAFAPGVATLITAVAEAIGLTGVMANLAVPVVGIITALIAGLGVAAATSVIGTDQATQATRDYTQALKDDNDTLGEHVRLQAAKALSDAGAFDAARTLGVSQTTLTNALMGVAGAQDIVNAAIKRGREFQNDWSQGTVDTMSGAYMATDAQKKMGAAIDTVTKTLDTQRDGIAHSRQSNEDIAAATESTTGKVTAQSIALQNQAAQYGTTVTALQAAKDAQDKTGQSTADTTLKLRLQNDAAGLLKMAWDELNGKTITAAQAQNAFDSSLANMGTHVDKVGKQITFTTTSITDMSAASVELRGQLIGQVTNMEKVIEADGGLQNATAQSKQKYAEMKEQIIQNAMAHGVNEDAARAYIDTIYKVPTAVTTKVEVDKAAADQAIADVQWRLDQIQTHKRIFIDVQQSTSNVDNTGGAGHVGKVKEYATGGRVAYLAGGGLPNFKPVGTDTVPAMLTPDEFVMKRSSAQSIGHGTLDYMNRTGQLPPSGQAQAGPMVMTGTLVLDSGEVMGTFRGIAQAEASAAVGSAGRDASRRPAR